MELFCPYDQDWFRTTHGVAAFCLDGVTDESKT